MLFRPICFLPLKIIELSCPQMPFVGVGVGVGSVSHSFFPRPTRCKLRRSLATMTLAPGTSLPIDKEFLTLTDGKPSDVKIADVFGGKKVVIFVHSRRSHPHMHRQSGAIVCGQGGRS